MAINCFFLFARNGDCLSYLEFARPKPCANLPSEQKLLFGLIHSLKRFCEFSAPASAKQNPDFHSFTTSTYKLHFYETPTGLKFILLSDLSFGFLREQLQQIHKIYVQTCAKNPLYQRGQPITSEAFISGVRKHVSLIKASTTGGLDV